MGRGRAKAKQTKVARDLKYRTFNTDFTSLERELRGGEHDDGPLGYPIAIAESDTRSDDDDGEDYPYTSRIG